MSQFFFFLYERCLIFGQNFGVIFLLRNVLISDMLRRLPETVLPKESKKLKKYKKATGNYTLQYFPAVISSFSI